MPAVYIWGWGGCGRGWKGENPVAEVEEGPPLLFCCIIWGGGCGGCGCGGCSARLGWWCAAAGLSGGGWLMLSAPKEQFRLSMLELAFEGCEVDGDWYS